MFTFAGDSKKKGLKKVCSLHGTMEKIRKAGALIILEKRLLIVKPLNKPFFINPGGKYEINPLTKVIETAEECLGRELKEELQIKLTSCKPYNTYEIAQAAHSNNSLSLELYFVAYSGELVVSREVESLEWMSREDFENKRFNFAPSFEVYIPDLIKEGLL